MKFFSTRAIGVAATIIVCLIFTGLSLVASENEHKKSFAVEVSGQGRPMILIPGLSCSGEVWSNTVSHYKDRYECHVLTLAGFAGQPRLEGPFLEKVRQDLAAYIRTHQLNRPIIVGHSLGGFVALWLASQNPDLVGPLVIVDALPFFPAGMYPNATVDTARPFGEQIRAQMLASRDQFVQSSQQALQMMVTKPKDRELVLSWIKATDPVAAGNAILDIYSHDLRQDLAKITSPSLVLGTWIGSKDFVSRDEMEKRIRAQFAKLKSAEIALSETRHFIMLDDPDWFFGQTDRFISKYAK